MNTPQEYKVRSSAVRAAKKEFGENWAESVEIFQRGEMFIYDFPRKNVDEAVSTAVDATLGSVQELLSSNAADIKDKAKKAKKIKESKPIHTPATIESAPAQGVDNPKPEENRDDGHDAAQKLADKQANTDAVNNDPLKPRISTAERPTKLVWDIADKHPELKRKEVIEECVRQGIAYGTARTQYQHWFKEKNKSALEPRATIGSNGQVIPAAKKV